MVKLTPEDHEILYEWLCEENLRHEQEEESRALLSAQYLCWLTKQSVDAGFDAEGAVWITARAQAVRMAATLLPQYAYVNLMREHDKLFQAHDPRWPIRSDDQHKQNYLDEQRIAQGCKL
jgi:hypothetical protein